MTTLLIVDDHPVVRQGIRSLLSNHEEYEVVGEADTAQQAITLHKELLPDVTLLDIRLGDSSGLDVLDQIMAESPDTKVLMLSSFDDKEYVLRSLRSGALGYVLKGDSDVALINAVSSVASGKHTLSPRVTEQVVAGLFAEETSPEATLSEDELSTLKLMAEGKSNLQIGKLLYLSQTTVKRRLTTVFATLGVSNRTEAAAEAVRRGLL